MSDPVVCTPLAVERAALAGAVRETRVVRTGMGPRRSTAGARDLGPGPRPLLVAGVAGSLSADVRPGDLVVGSEVRGGSATLACPSAPLLAGALRRRGLRVHVGPVASASRPVTGDAGRRLGAAGVLAVDMESAQLGDAAAGGAFAVVRAVVDTPDHPLRSAGTPIRGVRALQVLRRAAPVLEEWSAAAGDRHVLLADPCSFSAVRAIACASDLVLVVGSGNSSHSLRLVEVAERAGCRAHLVDDAAEVALRWLAGVRRIGVTAGAAAPPHLVDELVCCLSGLGRLSVADLRVADEDIRFPRSREVT